MRHSGPPRKMGKKAKAAPAAWILKVDHGCAAAAVAGSMAVLPA